MSQAGEFTDNWGLVNPEEWPISEPDLRNDIAWVTDRAAEARMVGSVVSERVDQIHELWSGLPEKFSGSGLDEAYGFMDKVQRLGQTEQDTFHGGAGVMDDYVEAIRPLFQRYKDVRDEATAFRSQALAGYEVSAQEVADGVLQGSTTPYMPSMSSPQDPAIGSQLVVWYHYPKAVARNDTLVEEVRQVTAKVREAQEDLVRALQGMGDQDVAHGGSESGGVGDGGFFLKTPAELAQMSPQELRDWWSSLSAWEREAMHDVVTAADLDTSEFGDHVADSMRGVIDDPSQGDNVSGLDITVQLFGDHDEVMGHAFAAMGAGGVLAAMNATVTGAGTPAENGAARRAEKLRILSGLRESLGTVAATWSTQEARAFVAGPGEIDDQQTSPAIGYLFADNYADPMPETLTVAMADKLDAIERGTWDGQYTDHTETPPHHLQDLLTLQGQEETAGRIGDPMGRVLSTMAAYPETALDWLTSESSDAHGDDLVGEARLDYYYAERPSMDGFEGVAALWRGAIRVDDGPYDSDTYVPGAGYDEAAWQKVATVTTRAMRGLEANPLFTPENVTTGGSVELAGAVSLNLPYLADTPVLEASEEQMGEERVVDFIDRHLPGIEGYRRIPNVSESALTDVLASAAANASGLAILDPAIGRYQDALVASAFAEQENPRGDEELVPTEVLRRTVGLQAIVDGARDGGGAGTAVREDERTKQAIDTVTTAVSLVPSPEVAWAKKYGADFLIDKLQGYGRVEVTSEGNSLVASLLADNLAKYEHETSEPAEARKQAALDTAEVIAGGLDMGESDLRSALDTAYRRAYTIAYDGARD